MLETINVKFKQYLQNQDVDPFFILFFLPPPPFLLLLPLLSHFFLPLYFAFLPPPPSSSPSSSFKQHYSFNGYTYTPDGHILLLSFPIYSLLFSGKLLRGAFLFPLLIIQHPVSGLPLTVHTLLHELFQSLCHSYKLYISQWL